MAKTLKKQQKLIRNSRFKAFSSTIMVFMVITLTLFSIGFASALEFDNVKDYNSDTKTITIENAFGLGDTVAEIKLNSELKVIVPRGYQKVAEFDLTYYKDDNGGLDLMEFYDIKKSMEKINRNFDYKVKGIEQVEVNDYKQECSEVWNETNKTYDNKCVPKITGSHLEDKVVWNILDKKSLLKSEKITIGVFTNVEKGDFVEWIPTFYGVKINEWATWTESMNANIVAYYTFDDNSSAVDSITGDYTGTTNNGVALVSGKIGNAFDFDGTNDYVDLPNFPAKNFGTQFTISFWMKTVETTSGRLMTFRDSGGSYNWIIVFSYTTEGPQIRDSGADAIQLMFDGNQDDGNWKHVVIIVDGTNGLLYLNNTLISNVTNADYDGITENMGYSEIGTDEYSGISSPYSWDGTLDEIGFWNRSLSTEEVNDLWNEGNGITYTNDFGSDAPNVTLNSPIDYYNSTSSLVTLNCTAFDDTGITNVSLYINGVINQTNSSGLNNTLYSWTQNYGQAYYNWSCEAYDDENQSTTATYRYFNVSSNAPNVTLNSPIDYYNSTSSLVTLNCTVFDDTGITNVSLYINGAINNTNSSGLNNTDYLWTYSFAEGYYNWSCEAYDDENQSTTATYRYFNYTDESPLVTLETPNDNYNTTNTEIDFECLPTDDVGLLNNSLVINGVINYTDTSPINDTSLWHLVTGIEDGEYNWTCTVYDSIGQSFTATERYFTIDTTSPTIVIDYPTNNSNYLDGYVTTTTKTIDLNWTTTDEHLDTCWYYNQTENVTLAACGDNATLNITYGTYTYNIYANDTFGYETQEDVTATWDYTILENDLSYSTETVELALETFVLNISYTSGDWSSISGFLNYAGTNYTATSITGSDTKILTKNLNIPSTDADVNNTFYWIIRLTNATGEYFFNSELNNQTVRNISIDDCGAYSSVLFNLTYVDEETQIPLNFSSITGAIEIDVSIYGVGEDETEISFSTIFEDDNNVAVCLNNNLSDNELYLDTKIKYYAAGYQTEYYNIKDYQLNFSSLTQNITLYGLNTTSATIFDILFKGSNFIPVADALIDITREYVSEGVFKTIEIPITDIDGKTTASLVKDNTVYTFIVYKEGELLATFQNVVPVCANELTEECRINLNAASTTTSIDDFTNLDDLDFLVTWDEPTKLITLTFSTSTGTSSDVNLNVLLGNQYENETICDTSVTSSSGTLTCTVPDSYTNQTVIVNVFKDNSFITSYLISLAQNPVDFFGYTGYFFAFVIIATIPFMFITSLIGVVIGVIIGVVMVSLLLLSTGANIYSITGGITWFLIAAVILIWKLNTTERR